MPTVCLRFRCEKHPKIHTQMEACAAIQHRAIDYALENSRAATYIFIHAFYFPCVLSVQISTRPGCNRPSAPGPLSPTPSETAREKKKPGPRNRRSNGLLSTSRIYRGSSGTEDADPDLPPFPR